MLGSKEELEALTGEKVSSAPTQLRGCCAMLCELHVGMAPGGAHATSILLHCAQCLSTTESAACPLRLGAP